jgi:thioredoxin-related protein
MKYSARRSICKLGFLLPLLLFSSNIAAQKIEPRPIHYELPQWFKKTFLEIPVDIEEAQNRGKKLLIFFHLDNCPACAYLLKENFVEGANRERIEKKFDVIGINVLGDLPVNWIDGTLYTEKQLARKLGVFATPAVLIMTTGPRIQRKIMGYKPSPEFLELLEIDK